MVLESNRDLVLRRLVECLSRDRTKHQVAEVTSLGLVQMTRKKLGLGLLETFSEPCEVCAGRGVIIHHDPVTKHRQAPQPELTTNRRSRGKGSSATGPAKGGVSTATGTHAITDDVRNALAKIAASTVSVASSDSAAAPAMQQETAIAILDIPVTKSRRGQRRTKSPDAEQLLGSVLEALPEPKQAGQGRSRVSRRAGSAGAVVSAPVTDD
jgi:ribonuclease E